MWAATHLRAQGLLLLERSFFARTVLDGTEDNSAVHPPAPFLPSRSRLANSSDPNRAVDSPSPALPQSEWVMVATTLGSSRPFLVETWLAVPSPRL